MAVKAIAVIEGKDTEVELKEIPKGFISDEQHGIRMGEEITRRVGAAVKNARTELLKDEEFFTEFTKTHGLVKKGEKGGDPSPERITELQQGWMKQHLEPLQQQLQSAQGEGAELRQSMLESQILAATPGLKKPYRTPPSEGAKPLIVTMLSPLFAWDPKTKMFALKKGDGFEFSSQATTEKPYKGIEEYLNEMQKNASFADWWEKTTQQGPQIGDVAGGPPASTDKPPTQWSSEERAKYIESHGFDAYQKLLNEEIRKSMEKKASGK